jgi:hypothetical protein
MTGEWAVLALPVVGMTGSLRETDIGVSFRGAFRAFMGSYGT